MERYDNIVKIEEIRKLTDEGQYQRAARILDTMDLHRIKSLTDLSILADVLTENERFDEAMELLNRIYEKSKTRRVIYQMVELAIKQKDVEQAEEYLLRYQKAAPHDSYRFIFRYYIDKLKGEPAEVLIDSLEQLKEYEYIEVWAYELAKLYHKAGVKDKCIRECSDIILWFGEGLYVDKAKLLKAYYVGEIDPVHILKAKDRNETIQRLGLDKTKDYRNIRDQINEYLSGAEEGKAENKEQTLQSPGHNPIADQEKAAGFGAEAEILKEEEVRNHYPNHREKEIVNAVPHDEELKAELDVTGPETAESKTAEFKAAEPERTEKKAESEVAEPEMAGPEITELVTELVMTEPEMPEDEIPDSNTAESEGTEPEEPAENGSIEYNQNTNQNIFAEEEERETQEKAAAEEKEVQGKPEEESIFTLFEKASFDYRKELGGFLLTEEVKGQFRHSLEGILSDSSNSRFLCIIGERQSGKTSLALKVCKGLYYLNWIKSDRIAKISGENLNKVDIRKQKDKLYGSSLIIENPGVIQAETAKRLYSFFKEMRDNIFAVLEGSKEEVNRFLEEFPFLKEFFAYEISLTTYTLRQLVVFAGGYLENNNYKLKGEAKEALASAIETATAGNDPEAYAKAMKIAVKTKKAAEERYKTLLGDILNSGKLTEEDLLYITKEDICTENVT